VSSLIEFVTYELREEHSHKSRDAYQEVPHAYCAVAQLPCTCVLAVLSPGVPGNIDIRQHFLFSSTSHSSCMGERRVHYCHTHCHRKMVSRYCTLLYLVMVFGNTGEHYQYCSLMLTWIVHVQSRQAISTTVRVHLPACMMRTRGRCSIRTAEFH